MSRTLAIWRTLFAPALLSLTLHVFASPLPAIAQSSTTVRNTTTATTAMVDEKAEQILQRAIEAQGGRAYLDVRSIVSRGYYT